MAIDNLLKMAASPTGTAALSIGLGAAQSIQANKLKNKAESAFPEMVDPNQSAFLAELGQKRKSMETGAEFASGMKEAESTGAGTMQAITQAAGGDSGSTIQGLLQAQKGINASKNQVLAQGQSQQQGVDAVYANMLNKISARKMQLQLQRSQQAMGEWAKKQGAVSQNLTTGVTGLLSSLGGGAGEGMDMGADANLAGKPSIDNTTMSTQGSEYTAPLRNTMFDSLKTERIADLPENVVPQSNLATQGLGPIMNLSRAF